MVRWSYHDGSTWTMVLFDGPRRNAEAIVGWAVLTLQEGKHPIVGAYLHEEHRGRGHGTALVRGLLDECKDFVPHGRIYAVSDWWPKYGALIAEAGFSLVEWE